MRSFLLDVGPLVYEVRFPRAVEGPDGDKEGFGRSLHGPGVIEVATHVGGERIGHMVTLDTLLHEVLHACFFAAGSPLEYNEELAVSALSLRLLETLRANPTLVELLLSDSE